MTPTRVAPLALLLTAATLAGCSGHGGPASDADSYAALGFDGKHWPDLHGETVTLLDHGAFDYMFGPAKEKFEALTNGTLEHIAAQDTGDALNRAVREKDAPSFDVVYGLDNAYLGKAIRAGALQPYTPLLSSRVNASYVFFGAMQPWPATPADHGYIAVNVDSRANLTINSLGDVLAHADEFVTPDPRFSSPGLGFLLATIATYPEGSTYDWTDYWKDLLDGGAKVTSDWTTAYAETFTGGYGNVSGGRPIVTSYSTSPAYELFYGGDHQNGLLLAPKSTFHQVETVAIAANARHPVAAQAFVEFVLTDGFQDLHAENNAVYPVVDGIDVAKVYAGRDPAPGSFQAAQFGYTTLAAYVEPWVREWTDIYEAHQA